MFNAIKIYLAKQKLKKRIIKIRNGVVDHTIYPVDGLLMLGDIFDANEQVMRSVKLGTRFIQITIPYVMDDGGDRYKHFKKLQFERRSIPIDERTIPNYKW